MSRLRRSRLPGLQHMSVDRAGLEVLVAGGDHPGVVHQHVEPPVVPHRPRRRAPAGGLVGQVAHDVRRVDAVRGQLAGPVVDPAGGGARAPRPRRAVPSSRADGEADAVRAAGPVTTATRPLRSNGEAVMARTMSRPVLRVGPQVMVIAAARAGARPEHAGEGADDEPLGGARRPSSASRSSG